MRSKKIIPYNHQWIDKEDIEAVIRVLKSDWITQGPKIAEFEKALCDYTKAKYAVAVSSATAALHLACLVCGIKAGDEVITSPITFVATANAIVYCGGIPVFADVQPDTANINPNEIEKKINKRIKTIIPVHFAGHPCDLEEIHKIAKQYHLTVIEDASHALGAEYKGEKIGSCRYSDMAVFSFHPVKSITTGEGGAILTNRRELYDRLILLRSHGTTKNMNKFTDYNPQTDGGWYYEMQELGYNYRITDIQCALGISQLSRLDKMILRRREIAGLYNKFLSTLDNFILPVEKSYIKSAWHLYVLKLKEKDLRKSVFEKLRKAGFGVQVHYIPVYLQPFYRNKYGYENGLCPEAESHYKKVISIPLFPKMSEKDVLYTIKNLIKLIS